MKLKVIRVRTKYWRPGTDHVRKITEAVRNLVEDGDIITISEKALSTALGLLINESNIKASRLAIFIAKVWMRKIWGGPLGRLTKLREKTLERLRSYPIEAGSAHKQISLRSVGLFQSLRHYSEGGIDASNIPYALVSLPLEEPDKEAARIKEAINAETGRDLSVMIVDGDTTYSWKNLHLAPRGVIFSGLIHIGGFLTFVFGRMLGLKARSTPLALSGKELNPDWALTLANIAHKVRGHGAGRTVWDMSQKLGTNLTGVTWEMLEGIEHFPLVIIRKSGGVNS